MELPELPNILHLSITKTLFCPGCVLEWGFDYLCNDISGHRQLAVKDVDHCMELCAALDQCTVWTFHPLTSKCWLKTLNSGKRIDAKIVSGTKECRCNDPHLCPEKWVAQHTPVLRLEKQTSNYILDHEERVCHIDEKSRGPFPYITIQV